MHVKIMNRFCIVAAALALLASCQLSEEDHTLRDRRQSDSQTGRLAGQIVITGTLEQGNVSKTALAANGKVVWKAGDRIKVFNASNPEGVEYVLEESSAGTVKGRFVGNAISGDAPFYAVYPAEAVSSLSGSTLTVNLPEVQDYASASFGEGASLSVASGLSVSSLDFQNMLGAVAFSYTGGKNLKSIRVQTKGSEPLCGSGKVTFNDGEPTLTLDASGSTGLTLDCSGSKDRTFYMMLPPGVFRQGFTVLMEDADGNVMFKEARASESNVVERSTILTMPPFGYEAQYKAAFLNADAYGFYTGTDASATRMDAKFTYNAESSQLAAPATQSKSTRYARVQDWNAGFAVGMTTPSTLVVGQEYDATLDLMQDSGRSTVEGKFRVIKISDDAAWLSASDGSGAAFIQPLK